ncbi:MAG: hypothetical protein AAFP69_11575 [Planctomycetota bacterium]
MPRIFSEDCAIFHAQQNGLRHSPHPGAISSREERIHQFQRYIIEKTGIEGPQNMIDANTSVPANQPVSPQTITAISSGRTSIFIGIFLS